jgi:cobalt-precorrin 5A hydrolase
VTRRKTAVYALTARGLTLGQKIAAGFSDSCYREPDLFGPRRLLKNNEFRPFDGLGQCLADNFANYNGHVVIGAIGLTVRLIAPLLKSKITDPAVVGLGQDGRFAVSLLSGHLGGANELTKKIACLTCGQAVVTTATDLSGKPALEVLARDNGFRVEHWANLAPVASALSEDEEVSVFDPFTFFTPLLSPWQENFIDLNCPGRNSAGSGLWVDYRTKPNCPENFLVLRPLCLTVGLGCHRNTEIKEAADLFDRTFEEFSLASGSVRALATLNRRAEEKALLDLAEKLDVPLISYTPQELSLVSAPNPSETVKKNIGVASVCEAAAILAARTGRLLVPKQKSQKATCAVALIDWKSSA